MRKAALAMVLLAACVPATPAAAQEGAADTAYVESVTGRVVALVNGKPVLLDALDTVTDKTRLDVLANSELRLCHYQKQRIVALAGPARISVTASGVTAENGKDIAPSGETCATSSNRRSDSHFHSSRTFSSRSPRGSTRRTASAWSTGISNRTTSISRTRSMPTRRRRRRRPRPARTASRRTI